MSERRHPGPHLDADRLSAFIEGALSEQERQESLAHLAECADCRSVVFLAQQAAPAPASEPTPLPAWRRWLPPLSLAAAAAAVACGLLVVLWMRPRPAPASPEIAVTHPTAAPLPRVSTTAPEAPPPTAALARSRQEFAAKRPAPPPAPAMPTMQAPAPPSSGAIGGLMSGLSAQSAQSTQKQAAPSVASEQPQLPLAGRGAAAVPLAAAPAAGSAAAARQAQGNVAAMRTKSLRQHAAPAASPTINGELVQAPAQSTFLASTGALHLTIEHNQGPDNGLSAIRGTVTDPSGAVVPRASVTLQSAAGTIAATATTDNDGRFILPPIVPGEYVLQISAVGFMTNSERLDLQARDVAVLAPVLQVGASTQTVEVSAESTALQPSSAMTDAQLAAIVPVLPGKLPAATTVVKNGRILALNTAGILYLSRDAGYRWKKIRPVWTGSIAHLALTEQAESNAFKKREIAGPATSLFELTTTDGAVWISSDGAHWRLR